MEVFKIFSYNKVITLNAFLNLVYLFLYFDMYSFVIKIAKLLNKAALDDITIPALGFNIASVL